MVFVLFRMDYIRKYDIELEKEQYYAGEVLRGWVVIENAENLRITGMLISDVLHNRLNVESLNLIIIYNWLINRSFVSFVSI